MTHEVGKQFGLKHPEISIKGNIMNQGERNGESLTSLQRGTAVQNANTKGAVNLGNNKAGIQIGKYIY